MTAWVAPVRKVLISAYGLSCPSIADRFSDGAVTH